MSEPPQDAGRALAAELMKLPTSYHVIHGAKRDVERGSIACLIIGPTGVWVIDAGDDVGEFVAVGGTLVNGSEPITPRLEAVSSNARYAREVLGVDANPVMCFADAKLPRSAQMVGRVRVVETSALADLIMAGQMILLPEHVQRTLERVGDWLRRPPGNQVSSSSRPPRTFAPPVEPRRRSRRIRVDRTRARSVVTSVLLLAALMAVCTFAVYAAIYLSGDDDPVPTTPTTTAVELTGADFLTVAATCPEAGGGYRLVPERTGSWSGRTGVTAVVDGQARVLGQFGPSDPMPAVAGVGPAATVGFDIQIIDGMGEGGTTYHSDITTPPSPC